jgi:hypothetical protein
MNNAILKILLVIVGYLVLSQNVDAKQPRIEWTPKGQSPTLAYAKSLFDNGDLPSSETDLLKRISISVEKGSVVKKVSRISYLPTFTEAHDQGTEYIYWDEATTDLILTEASVVLPNGKSVRMSPSNIRVRDSDEYNTFTNSKEVVIPLSGVVSGSMIVLEYQKHTELSSLESLYSEAIYPVGFQRDLSLFELVFDYDDSLDIQWFSDADSLRCNHTDSRLRCEGNNLKKLPYDASMLWRDELSSIVIAQKADWQQVVKHVKTAFNKSDYDSQQVRDFALQLTKDTEHLHDKISVLHGYASRSIRYVSMSELGHRITPHTFAEVIQSLFGDCKDKSALLVGMLRAIGVDAFPVLVATERRNPLKLKVPSSNYFDHMVVCFDKQEKRYCLDPTNTSTDWRTPASWIQGRVALELIDDAQPNSIRLDDYKWVLRSTSLMEFDKLANVKESQTRVFSGVYAGQLREGLLSSDDKSTQEWLLSNYQENVSTLTEPEFKIELLDSQVADLKIHSNADYEPYYSADQDLSLIEYDSWIRAELSSSKVVSENYGAWVDGTYLKSEMIYDFAALWDVTRLPATLKFEDDIATLRRSVVMSDDGKLKVNTELWIKSHFVPQGDVEGYNKMIDVLLEATNIHAQGKLVKQ